MDKKEIGKRIKLIRKYKGLTREEFAQRLNVSKYTIANYEQGQRGSNMNVLSKIADALEVPINELLNPTSTQEMIQNSISKKEETRSIGECFAEVRNKKDQEINLLYNLLKIRYGEEIISMNKHIDEQFVELIIGDKNIVYTKEDFEKFIDHIVNLFPTFKMILDNSKK